MVAGCLAMVRCNPVNYSGFKGSTENICVNDVTPSAIGEILELCLLQPFSVKREPAEWTLVALGSISIRLSPHINLHLCTHTVCTGIQTALALTDFDYTVILQSINFICSKFSMVYRKTVRIKLKKFKPSKPLQHNVFNAGENKEGIHVPGHKPLSTNTSRSKIKSLLGVTNSLWGSLLFWCCSSSAEGSRGQLITTALILSHCSISGPKEMSLEIHEVKKLH